MCTRQEVCGGGVTRKSFLSSPVTGQVGEVPRTKHCGIVFWTSVTLQGSPGGNVRRGSVRDKGT